MAAAHGVITPKVSCVAGVCLGDLFLVDVRIAERAHGWSDGVLVRLRSCAEWDDSK
jgi:hypothetical protein